MDHDDLGAALIYQHATSKADQAIARRINAAVNKQRSKRVDAVGSLEVEENHLRRPRAADLAEDQAHAPDGEADR